MRILVTGGAGFIGSNLAAHFAKEHKITVFDSLERKGADKNLKWLGGKVRFVQGEIGNINLVQKLVEEADVILHLAAQVAVTNSLKDPMRDFEVNALGTFNLLESARKLKKPPLIVYSSTNKVYGKIAEDGLIEKETRYIDKKHPQGISEDQPLDFYSPYGCSKGAADSYIRDYGRIYGLPTIVLRKSCVYGARQFGTEDQGWVAHFVRKALNNEPITIYGNGKQLRDLLYVSDLVELYRRIISEFKIDKSRFHSGVYNVGGGKKNAISLLELVDLLEKELNKKIKIKFADWRPGDQKVYVSNTTKAKKVFKWDPKTSINYGLTELVGWIN